MRVAAHFRPGTAVFWATTYALDLKLFDQYLLRQLGGPPINAVVLVDHWRLGEMWNRVDPDEHYLARQANRVYLLRGVRLPGGGAFHPKTYLFGRRDGSTLLVGSGNLTRRGIDAGKEVFTSLRQRHRRRALNDPRLGGMDRPPGREHRRRAARPPI